MRLTHTVMSVIVVVLGSFGNIVVITGMVRAKIHREASNILVLNLCINNFIVAAMFVPFFTIQSLSDSFLPVYGLNGCQIVAYFMYSLLGAETFGLVLITVNRYIRVSHFNMYTVIYNRPRNIIVMLFLSWTVHPLFLILPLTEQWGKFSYDPYKLICHPVDKGGNFQIFIVSFTMATSVPTFIYCYLRILLTFWASRKRINAVRSTSTGKKTERRKHELQTVLSVLLILLGFFVCYVPYFVVTLSDPWRCRLGMLYSIVTTYLALCHCWINPTIYAFLNPQIKTAIKKLSQCK